MENIGVQFDPNATCSQCGKRGAYNFDGKLLCSDCYANYASCCPEFGDLDLTQKPEENEPKIKTGERKK